MCAHVDYKKLLTSLLGRTIYPIDPYQNTSHIKGVSLVKAGVSHQFLLKKSLLGNTRIQETTTAKGYG